MEFHTMGDDNIKWGISGEEDLDYMDFGPKYVGSLRSAYLHRAKCLYAFLISMRLLWVSLNYLGTSACF